MGSTHLVQDDVSVTGSNIMCEELKRNQGQGYHQWKAGGWTIGLPGDGKFPLPRIDKAFIYWGIILILMVLLE